MKKLTSLHTMTEYSFLQSAIRIDSLIQFALDKDLKSLAITDRNNMHGVAEFIEKCKKNNIKPIIGIDLDIDSYRFILLAKNYEGYQYLSNLASEKAKGENISLNNLKTHDIFVIDHPVGGYFQQTNSQLTINNYFVGTTKDIGNGVFIQETRTIVDSDIEVLKMVDSLAAGEKTKNNYDQVIPYVFETKESAPVNQAIAIAEACNVNFPISDNFLPKFDKKSNIASIAYLKKIINNSAKKFLENKNNKEEYVQRIKYEISVIEKLGFADYFLIIWDLIKHAKEKGIIVGPGRGSAAGSLVSFLLDITEIDPLKYDLLFERFLNPERVSMPDIDIDIQDTKREEVVKYLFDKYGKENTALISTFQKLGAKSAMRDVARLLEVTNSEAIELTKLIPNNTSLDEAFNTSSRFRSAVTKSERNQEIFDLAKKIEGLPRQIGTHAAGVVISDTNVVLKAPTINSSDGLNQLQYSMDFIESYNLLKIDVLGLRNLTILQSIQQEVFKNFKKKVDLKKIPLNDAVTNKLLSDGDTNGVFQFESYGMKKTLKNVKVSSFDDIVAILSLYRPGPMEYIDTYAKRKANKENTPKITKEFDEVVKNTYGIIVYQEQIMQISQRFAGMSFGQADILRRAIGKKNAYLIGTLKKTFINGAIKKGSTQDLAERVYKQIEAFANYGFNKSHAVAYATLSYRLAYLKARFPFEFYTSLINASVSSLTSLKTYINEAQKRGINIKAPNINLSDLNVLNINKSIILPLGIIKGLGNIANQKIMNERSKRVFDDFFDVVARLKINGLGESIITSLIQGNALRDFGNMQTLIDSLPQALRYASMIEIKKDGEKFLDFDIIPKPNLIEAPNDIPFEVKSEIGIYGFNIHATLTLPYEKEHKLIDLIDKQKLTIPVLLEFTKKIKDKNGNDMGIFSLSDSSITIEAFAFREVFKFIDKTKKGTIIMATIEYNQLRKSYTITTPWKDING